MESSAITKIIPTSFISTTIAIAIVAETCFPYCVIPSLMNEYRVPELNVQNGVLKSLSFLFEYIGESTKDYVDSVSYLLEDSLMERDMVHRQISFNIIKHITLNVVGKGKEDYKMTVKVGDTVLYGKYSGSELKFDGKDYLIMREDDILAII